MSLGKRMRALPEKSQNLVFLQIVNDIFEDCFINITIQGNVRNLDMNYNWRMYHIRNKKLLLRSY